MVVFTIVVSVAMIIITFFATAKIVTLILGISLSCLFGIATLMITVIYCKLKVYFQTFLTLHDEKKMNFSAGI